MEKSTDYKYMVLGFSVQSHNLSKATLWFLFWFVLILKQFSVHAKQGGGVGNSRLKLAEKTRINMVPCYY